MANKNYYALTNPQKSIWQTGEFYKGTSIGNITGTVIISQNVDFKALEKAINLFVKKNDSFRLKFTVKDSIPMQYVDDFTEFNIEILSVESDKDVKRIERNLCDTPFDVLENFLYIFKIFKFSNGNGGFVINAHHLISDAWTAGLVVNEIMGYYEALVNKESILDEEIPSYIEYINSENEYLNSEKFEKDKVFWNEMFDTVPEPATIPTLKTEKNQMDCASKRKLFTIPKETIGLISEFCKSHRVSEFNFFMGVISIYLSRVSGLDEFVIGTPILNRGNFKEKQTTGMYISTVPFKVSLNPDDLFGTFVSNISTNFLQIFRHQKYPYQYLLQDLRKKNSSIPNLYNILMSYQNARSNKQTAGINYDSRWIGNNNISDDIDIHLYDMNDTGSMNIAYDYLISKYSIDDICAIHARILYVINQVLENNEIKINEIEIVTPDEKSKILNDFNNTYFDYPKDKTIIDLFEEQVLRTPDNTAIVFGDQSLTYKELNEKANSLAYYLRYNENIDRNNIVGIMTPRSLEMIISILAILKAGGCYVPIDPEYPQDRIEYMLENSKAKALLTFKRLQNKVDFENKIFVELANTIYEKHKNNIDNINKPEDLAYIIYTSGSTGKPKGVMLSHKNVNNFTSGMKRIINFSQNKTIVSVTTISFDIFVLESILPLQSGLKIVLANEDEQVNAALFNKLCVKNKVNIVQTTPSRFQFLIADKENLEYMKNITDILVGGEPFPTLLLKKLKNISSANIYNVYGPTETTVWSTVKDLTNSNTITIGKPIANTTCYILDKNKHLLPINTPGNLFIGGDGVSRGYYENNDLTQEKFIINQNISNNTIYDTGDLAYYTDLGELVHLGRNDFQIKLNGHRIELEEIENKILSFGNIENCVVTKNSLQDNHEFLCAYYTSEKNIDVTYLKHVLKKSLPLYMVPQYFIKIETLPYTSNGKIDRKKLPSPNIEAEDKKVVLPRNFIDEKLVDILEDILNIPTISIDDSLFEIGGDSLTAINLCTKIYSEFNVEIIVKDILETPVISDLSDLISLKSGIDLNDYSVKKADKLSSYPVSSAQKRTYYASNIAGSDSTLYNISGGLILDQMPDINKLEDAFKKLITRHSSLRTYFEIQDDVVVQKILDEFAFKLDIESNHINNNQIESVFKDFVKPFDLSKAPLFRAKLIPLEHNKAFLAIDMHHIIADGTSLSVLVNDLCKIYNDEELTKLNTEYKDYAIWENDMLQNGYFEESENYWINQFSDDVPVLNLPTKPRPAIQSFEGNKIYSEIDRLKTEEILKLSKDLGVTPYMILLSTYYILLSVYTSQQDIVVGTPIVNRSSSELYGIVGMFINSLPLRANINTNSSFKEFLQNIKDLCLESYKNQSYPFDELVNKLNFTRDISRNPLFDTMFIYQNNGYAPVSFGDISAKYFIPDSGISKFDLSLEVVPTNGKYNLSFEYATKLFDRNLIKQFSEHYINILTAILENPDTKIADICMLSKDEQHTILFDFNNTKLDYEKDKTLAQLFEQQVEKTPDKTAIVFADATLTYKELNEKANSLAYYLREKNIGKNDIVGIIMNRSLEMIISIIAVLKSGGAYLPIDPTYPKSRITYMIEDSKVKYILTKEETIKKFENIPNSILVDLNSSIYENPNTNLKTINTPDDLAYLIYTSGSTGKPKGVMLTQRNVNNFIAGTCNKIKFENTIVSVTTMCFDIFVLESILPLLNGLKIVLANESEQNIPKLLNRLCVKNNVKMIQTTPARMSLLLSDTDNLEYIQNMSIIMLGGEPFPYNLLKQLKILTNAKIYNMYGPTETTVWSSIKDLSESGSINIGNPIANTQMYILDKNHNILPIGVTGDLYIGGDGVSKGYLNKESLTAEKFIKNKYIENDIIYNTGDLARWLSNGEIDCIGRSDSQVKLRGLRIELGEIEEQILSFPGIENSAVCIKTDSSDRQFLCGYFTSSERISISELKNYISKFLPNYMIPAFLIQLEKFKYTPNGKVDKNSLPLPSISQENDVILPKTEIEQDISQIWEALLGISPISTDENFFNIGGDSILALKMQIELLNKNINVSYADIFKYNTIKDLAKRIVSLNKDTPSKTYYEAYNFNNIDQILKENNLNNIKKIQKNKIGNILLTGSTGFLGSHILDYLLSKTKSNVYCLIRKDRNNETTTVDKLLNKMHYYFGNKYDELLNKRFFVITSDITDKKLGLEENEIENIFQNISHVINCAALVKHYGEYSEFEKINVNAVKNLIDYCKKYNKKFIQISTISVSGNTLTDLGIQKNVFTDDIDFTENNLYINQPLDNVYIRSKFEAERIILEDVYNKSLDALILRVGNITSRFSDGKFQPNANENAFLNRLKAFIELKSIPEYILNDYVEFSPVDDLAKSIVKSIECAPSTINVLHLYNQNHVYINKLIKMLPKGLINVVSDTEFKNILNRNLQISTNKDIISYITNDLDKNKKLIYQSNIKIKNKISAAFLKNARFKWHKIDKKYIEKLLSIL